MNKYIILFIFVALLKLAYSEDSSSDVIIITDQNLNQVQTGNWLVEFYAPWCGFCKKLAPIYEELATKVKGKYNIAKVDCTEQGSVCQRFMIAGYPTLKYISNGAVYDFVGEREVESFEKFMAEGYKSQKSTPFPDDTKFAGVVEFDGTSFAETSNGDRWIVVFYAPWCGFCKKYMPGFEKIAPSFKGSVSFGKVNCQEHPNICELYKVPGYPTFKMIEGGGYRDFPNEPNEQNLIQYLKSGYIDQILHPKPWHPIFGMIHAAILEYVYLFLLVTFLLGLALGYTFFAPSALFPDQPNTFAQPQPAKQEKND